MSMRRTRMTAEGSSIRVMAMKLVVGWRQVRNLKSIYICYLT